MFESKSGVLLIAGLGFFLLAFLSNGVIPILMYAKMPEKTVEQTIDEQLKRPGPNIMTELAHLRELYADQFKKYGFAVTKEHCADLLRKGRKIYIAEGCWHCHSQFVRPVSREEERFGPVSKSWEYQNELQRPVMFGTRRVGPDLSREGGRRSSDWHAVHFHRPRDTSPLSVMPEYPWFFDGNPGQPNERGLAIILYMQWLGSWLDTYGHYDAKENAEVKKRP
jgi:hypothetical protein